MDEKEAFSELVDIANAADPKQFIRHPFQVNLPMWKGKPLSEALFKILSAWNDAMVER
jgi:hypothetical protein